MIESFRDTDARLSLSELQIPLKIRSVYENLMMINYRPGFALVAVCWLRFPPVWWKRTKYAAWSCGRGAADLGLLAKHEWPVQCPRSCGPSLVPGAEALPFTPTCWPGHYRGAF